MIAWDKEGGDRIRNVKRDKIKVWIKETQKGEGFEYSSIQIQDVGKIKLITYFKNITSLYNLFQRYADEFKTQTNEKIK